MDNSNYVKNYLSLQTWENKLPTSHSKNCFEYSNHVKSYDWLVISSVIFFIFFLNSSLAYTTIVATLEDQVKKKDQELRKT